MKATTHLLLSNRYLIVYNRFFEARQLTAKPITTSSFAGWCDVPFAVTPLMAKCKKAMSTTVVTRDRARQRHSEKRNLEDAIGNALNVLRLDTDEIEYAGAWCKCPLSRGCSCVSRNSRIAYCCSTRTEPEMQNLPTFIWTTVLIVTLFEERKACLLLEERGLKDRLANLERKMAAHWYGWKNSSNWQKARQFYIKMALPEEKRDLLKKLTSNLKVTEKNVDVELKIPAQIIARRSKDTYCSPQRGVPRTATHFDLDEMLEKLLKHFVSEAAPTN